MDAEEFADRLRAAYAEGFEEGLAAPAPFVADVVEIVHDPANPVDGERPGSELAEMWSREGPMLRSAMPDVDLTDVAIDAHGDEVELRAMLRGTSPDGSTLAHPYTVRYTLRAGRSCARSPHTTPAP
jgi:hypothetical protein